MSAAFDAGKLYSLVVVGSSAGGIEALSTLVATLPADFPAPLVLAQHLDPRQPSHLGEILAKHSALPVSTVVDSELLKPGTVYVVPADCHVEVADHMLRLHVQDATERKGPTPSVNQLLTSAALAYGEQLIAVILTGTGSDGASGARAVNAAGGTVIIENPATAAYPGMPESVAPALVDFVSDLRQIGPLLRDLLAHHPGPAEPEVDELLEVVFSYVRQQSGIDFHRYKRPSILRRLQRRMIATDMNQLADYVTYLVGNPEECSRLVASFLINVTDFFRDPELFADLRERVLPDLIAYARVHNQELRIWSAGCATGEEAYSLAILVADILGDELDQFAVQIFATDVDEDAVAFARRGLYAEAALAHVPEAIRARMFTQRQDNYEIAPRVRGLVIFGQHDLGQRAPFPRIDLVMCRNVLIYFTSDLQRRTLQLFAFALRPGGVLVLGKAETASQMQASFTPSDEHLKIYRRTGDRVLPPISRLMPLTARQATQEQLEPRRAAGSIGTAMSAARLEPADTHRTQTADSGALRVNERLGRALLNARVGVVAVDRQYDIQIINDEATRLLGIYAPAVGNDLLHITRGIPIAPLRAALDATLELLTHGATERATTVTVPSVQGEPAFVQITCYPYVLKGDKGKGADRDTHGLLVFVSDATNLVRQQQAAAEIAARVQTDQTLAHTGEQGDVTQHSLDQIEENARLRERIEQISALNQTLLQANRELFEANRELRDSSEVMAVGREEAQAGTEEIKTLNEELQATNEELVTVNEELEATVEELHTANDDLTSRSRELQRLAASLESQHQVSEAARAQLAAILLSMGDALMVVDAAGSIVLTNAAYARLFGSADAVIVAENTEGQLLPPEEQPQRRAVNGIPFNMHFALTVPDGARRWFEATGQPIGSTDAPHGGVVTIRDITERRLRLLQDEFLLLASHELRSPLTSLLLSLQLLAKRPSNEVDGQEERHAIQVALRQGQRLRVLINDLLDVGRVEQHKLRLQLVPVDLSALVVKTTEAAKLDAPSQKIVVDMDAQPLIVTGDPTRLEQIVLNLLTNAIKYAPDTLRIDVRLKRVSGEQGEEAQLQVQDYGPGISAGELPLLFTRYFQSAQVGSKALGGLGLGLFITKELVTAHGGSITAASVVGEGTTFTVRLPLAVSSDGHTTPSASASQEPLAHGRTKNRRGSASSQDASQRDLRAPEGVQVEREGSSLEHAPFLIQEMTVLDGHCNGRGACL